MELNRDFLLKIINLHTEIISQKITQKYTLSIINSSPNNPILKQIQQTNGDLSKCLSIIKPKNLPISINSYIYKISLKYNETQLPSSFLFQIWIITQLSFQFNIPINQNSQLLQLLNRLSISTQPITLIQQFLSTILPTLSNHISKQIDFLNSIPFTNPFLLNQTLSFLTNLSKPLPIQNIENISIYTLFGEVWSPFMYYYRNDNLLSTQFNIIDWITLTNKLYLNPQNYTDFYNYYQPIINLFEENPIILKTPYITLKLYHQTLKQLSKKTITTQELLETGYNFKDFFDDEFVFSVFRGKHYPFIALWTIPNEFPNVPILSNLFMKFPELTGAYMADPRSDSEYNLFRADVLKTFFENENSVLDTPFYNMLINLNYLIEQPIQQNKSFEIITEPNLQQIFTKYETNYNLPQNYLNDVFNKFVISPYENIYNPEKGLIDLVDLIELQGEDYKLIEKIEKQKILNFFYTRDIISFFIPFLRNLNLTISPPPNNPLPDGSRPYIISQTDINKIILIGNNFELNPNLEDIQQLIQIINKYTNQIIPNTDYTQHMEMIMSSKPFWFWSPQERIFRINNATQAIQQINQTNCSDNFILKLATGGFMLPTTSSNNKQLGGKISQKDFRLDFSSLYNQFLNKNAKMITTPKSNKKCDDLINQINHKINSVCLGLGQSEMLNNSIIPQEQYRYLFGNSHNVNPFMDCLNFRTKVFNDRGVNTFFYQYNTLINKIYDQSVMFNSNNLFPAQFIFDKNSFLNQYLQNTLQFINQNMIFIGFLKINFTIDTKKMLKKRKVPYFHPIYLNKAHLEVIRNNPEVFMDVRKNQLFSIQDLQGIEIQKGRVSKTWMTTFLEFNEFTKMNFSLPQEKILLENDSWFNPSFPNLILMSRRINNHLPNSPFLNQTNPLVSSKAKEYNLQKAEFYTGINNASSRKRLSSNNYPLPNKKDFLLTNFKSYQTYLMILVPEKLQEQYSSLSKQSANTNSSKRSVDANSSKRSINANSSKRSVDANSSKRSVDANSSKRSIDANSSKRSVDGNSSKRSVDANSSKRGNFYEMEEDIIKYLLNNEKVGDLDGKLFSYLNFLNESFKEENRVKLLKETSRLVNRNVIKNNELKIENGVKKLDLSLLNLRNNRMVITA